jgi:hypothetical protein
VAAAISLFVALFGFLTQPSSAAPMLHAQTGAAAIARPNTQVVGTHADVIAVQGRERAPNYDRSATGSSVAAEEGAGTGVTANLSDLPAAARTTTDDQYIFDRLEDNNGISPELASARLHAIKAEFGLGGADNVAFTMSGDVYDPVTGEYLAASRRVERDDGLHPGLRDSAY